MRVIRCVTIVSREVFFFLRLCGFVSLITELRDCPLRKQPKFCDATNGFPAKFRVRNERRNSILMTRFSSDWLKQICHTARPMRSTTQIRVSALVPQTSFRETKPLMASRNVDFFLGLSQ